MNAMGRGLVLGARAFCKFTVGGEVSRVSLGVPNRVE